MVPPTLLAAFALACLVQIMVPGPSVAFIVSRAIAFGRRTALATVAGNAVGEYLQVVAVAFGISAVLERSVAAVTVLKLIGAGYLIFLGVRAIRNRRGLATVGVLSGAPTTWRAGRDAFIVGVTNVKTLVFVGAVMPQFADPAAGNTPVQLLLLGLVFMSMAVVSDTLWGLTAGTAQAWIARSPRRLSAIGGVSGLTLIGLGVGIALSGRKD
jgi:threonine/homoserine/homoserine lactone efflux protein